MGGVPLLGGPSGGQPAQRDAAPDAMLGAGSGGAVGPVGENGRNVEITPVEVPIKHARAKTLLITSTASSKA